MEEKPVFTVEEGDRGAEIRISNFIQRKIQQKKLMFSFESKN